MLHTGWHSCLAVVGMRLASAVSHARAQQCLCLSCTAVETVDHGVNARARRASPFSPQSGAAAFSKRFDGQARRGLQWHGALASTPPMLVDTMALPVAINDSTAAAYPGVMLDYPWLPLATDDSCE